MLLPKADQDRGSSGTGSTGPAEPINFGRMVLIPSIFEEKRLTRANDNP